LEPPDDVELIHSVARRDREAFEALYYRYAPRLGRYAFKLLQKREAVDEVINDAMLVAWQNAARFDEKISTVSAWLYGITHNKVIKMLDRTKRGAREEPAEQIEPAADLMNLPLRDPEREAMGRQLGAALLHALSRLPAEQRAVIELAFGEGQSYQEIAQVMGCPVNTVKTRMFHARKRLSGYLAEESEPGRSGLP
jgi:RNA polymerase sigma-70 factor (ECF subfamily)